MFENTIKAYLKTHLQLNETNRFIISVSGGMDSMALLSICKTYNPIVIYFNHQKRDDVTKDIDLIASYCKIHALTFYVEDIILDNKNFQSSAHEQRHHKLIRLAKDHHIKDVLTAHHADDQIETILMRLVRGSDIEGYLGLKTPLLIEDVMFHKPMLDVPKTWIISYVALHQIPYHEDSSNTLDDYFRNRLRHKVIPLLKEENPNLTASFSKFHTQLNNLHSLVYQKTTSLSREQFNALPVFTQLEYLKQLLRSYAIPSTYQLLHDLLDIIQSKQFTSQVDLKLGYLFILEKDRFYIDKKPTFNHDHYEVSNGIVEIGLKKLSIFYDNAPTQQGTHIKVCYNKVALPLIIRHRLPGDRLTYPYGTKKLKQLFIDAKVPKHKRDEFIILVDQQNLILWVEDIYTNTTLKTENTVYIQQIGDNKHAS